MRWLRGLLDRIVLLVCVLAGGAAPSFAVQYAQRLRGRLEQVRADLAPFQVIADRLHGGDLPALVAHHRASSDPTFRAEGAAIEMMVEAERHYVAELAAMLQPLPARLWHLLTDADQSLVAATWQDFEPAFTFTGDAVLVALVLGVLVWAVFLGCWSGCAAGARRLDRRSSNARRAAPTTNRSSRFDTP